MKTTKKQFDLFVSKVQGFIETLGLKTWDITMQYGDQDDGDQASVVFNIVNRVCTFGFAKTCPAKLSDRKISKIAFHEVLELFFADFRIHMNLADTMVDQIIHEKIRTLENVLYDDIPDEVA